MENKKIRKEMFASVLSSLIAITLFIICDVFFKMTTWGSYISYEYNFIFAIFFGIVIYSLLFAITKKTWRATLIRIYYYIFDFNN